MKASCTARLVAAALALEAFAPAVARAEAASQTVGSFSVDRFDPTPPGDRFASVGGAGIDGEELFRAGLLLEYAKDPLVLRSVPSPIVEHQIVLHVNLSLALWQRLMLSASLPIVLLNHGARVVVEGPPETSLAAPNQASLGNILLGARAYVFSTPAREIELAVGGTFWLPSGRKEHFTGDLGPRAMPYAAASGTWRQLAYAGHVGVMFQPSQDVVDVHLGPELRFGVAAALVSRGDRFQVGPELLVSVPFADGAGQARGLKSAELLGAGRFRLGDVLFGLGFGPALARGVGTPRFRALMSVAFAPLHEKDADRDGVIDMLDACKHVFGAESYDPELRGCPPDGDADGVLDVADACPNEPGVSTTDEARNGCPIPTDRDGDGFPDKVDGCPDDRGAASLDPKKNGCPSDRDGDGTIDAEDACVSEPGPDDADPKKRGCPVDSDADGIPDDKDGCPSEAGPPNDIAGQNGCPEERVAPDDPIPIQQ